MLRSMIKSEWFFAIILLAKEDSHNPNLMFSEVIVILMQIREYHRKHPAARVVDSNDEYEALLKEEPAIEFSGEVSIYLYS